MKRRLPTGFDPPPAVRETTPTAMRPADGSVYGMTFWFCYVANLSLTMAFAMLFRYADFVAYLGGNELNLGLIVGVGMFGALAVRAVQGVAIDHYGPRLVWLLSLASFTASCLLHLLIQRVDGPGIYLARMLLTTGAAGAFGASLTYVSLRVPPNRMAEMIGTLGTSGFIGIGLGPAFADFLCASDHVGREQIVRMFVWAAALGGLAFLVTCFATQHAVRIELKRRPPLFAVVRKYHPGVLLLVAFGTGMAQGLPHTFVRAYAAELNIDRVGQYFLVYASVAFTVRMLTRRIADRRGVRSVILCGFLAAATSMFLYLAVHDAISLTIPAVFAGIAHALVFPAVMAGGNAAFPIRYRGIATTLMFAMFDVGNLIGQPTFGGIVRLSRWKGWPAYPTMFVTVACVLLTIASFYAYRSRPERRMPQSD